MMDLVLGEREKKNAFIDLVYGRWI